MNLSIQTELDKKLKNNTFCRDVFTTTITTTIIITNYNPFQATEIEAVKACKAVTGRAVDLAGDGKFDSPG